jgi:hypothetical protein
LTNTAKQRLQFMCILHQFIMRVNMPFKSCADARQTRERPFCTDEMYGRGYPSAGIAGGKTPPLHRTLKPAARRGRRALHVLIVHCPLLTVNCLLYTPSLPPSAGRGWRRMPPGDVHGAPGSSRPT